MAVVTGITESISESPPSPAKRWAQYEAEIRVNLLRTTAIAMIYGVHFAHYLAAKNPDHWLNSWGLGLGTGAAPDRKMHLAISSLAVIWLILAGLVHASLRGKFFPPWLMYVSTAADVSLLTSLLAITRGPVSPLVSIYFLIVAMTGLRLDLRLVRAGTICAMLGYVVLLGIVRWPSVLVQENQVPTVPRYHQIIVLIALGMVGITVGQILRLARCARLGDDAQ